jgi:hypothetical protein
MSPTVLLINHAHCLLFAAQLLSLSDLEQDFLNPFDLSARINRFVVRPKLGQVKGDCECDGPPRGEPHWHNSAEMQKLMIIIEHGNPQISVQACALWSLLRQHSIHVKLHRIA